MNTGDERFEFTAKAKKNLIITIVIGLVLAIIGVFAIRSGGGHGDEGHGDGHEVVAESHDAGHTEATGDHSSGEAAHGGGEHHAETAPWLKRVYSNLWINTVFFAGLGLIGVFFFAIQYAAQAGWSAGIKRIPLAFGAWLPIAFLLILVMFFVAGGDLFHWTHASAFVGDAIMTKKAPFFYWPLSPESGVPAFWLGRLILFFGVWYLFFTKLRKLALAEDIEAGTDKWVRMRKLSAGFLVFFAFSSSIASWDWVMSIDTHWFSTMFGWYNFASWWVAGLALTTFLVVMMKEKGLLAVVNENHIHDLGKFVFAFSIFWTYIWFSQFLLIYYAHIPEETVYFMDRWKGPYSGVFYFNLIINFFFPFLVLMTRDAKRHTRILKVVCPAIVFGHWMDFYLMITPGTLKFEGGFGFLEVGLIMVFLGSFLYVVLRQIAKAPLYAKNHPMLEESLHHHI
ncbi:MAG: quinol:cytochrome C oxidoreductase [Cyclobacteriaceae bacterium]